VTTGAVEKQSITYSECMYVALRFQHAMHLHRKCHLLSARFCSIFPSYPINCMIFRGGEEKEKKMNKR